MSFDRAIELGQQTHHTVKGYVISDLLLHYGCEIAYELKKFNKLVIADLPLIGTPKNILNSLRVLISGGVDLASIHYQVDYVPPDKFLPNCILSVVDAAPESLNSLVNGSKYPYLICKNQQLAILANARQKKLIVTNQNLEPGTEDFLIQDWWTFLDKRLID